MTSTDGSFEPLPQPQLGRWIWKEETNSLEFTSSKSANAASFSTGVDSKDKRKRNKNISFGDGRKGDRATPVNKYGIRNQAGGRMQQGRYGGRSPRPNIKAYGEHTTVTLDDVKEVSLASLAEVHNPAEGFEDLVSTPKFDDFLIALLNYFDGFFEKLAQEKKPKTLTTEPSRAEKQYLAELSQKLEAAQKRLAQSYCVLVLGLGMDEFHHMGCGQQRVSSTYKDRDTYETFYKYCVYVVWVVFRRKEFELVNKEIGRMLRSDVFNPALRVKHATDKNKEDSIKNQDKKKLTPAEYRRQHPRRPAIKSIINQRSPVLVSVLPSPKEESNWLFKKPRPSSASGLSEFPSNDDDDDDDEFDPLTAMKKLSARVGIIGEPLNQFNSSTLAPVGSEQDEENEESESRRGSTFGTPGAPGTAGAGVSRAMTDISQTTTEAPPDDEDEDMDE
ncbi:protein phosphatase 1 regulatory subunit 36-like isoform X2 [Glandiceps talaboti]